MLDTQVLYALSHEAYNCRSLMPDSACSDAMQSVLRAVQRLHTHLLAEVNWSNKHTAGIQGTAGDYVGHVTDMRAIPYPQHVRDCLYVAVAKGDPGANLGAKAAQVDGNDPCVLEVCYEAPKGALQCALSQPEAHAVQGVPPAPPHDL